MLKQGILGNFYNLKDRLISPENIARVNPVSYIIQSWIIPVGDDAAAQLLEVRQVSDNLRAKETGAAFQRRLIDDNLRALGLDPLHHALDGRRPEVIRIRFHCQPIDADHDFPLLRFLVGGEFFAFSIGPGNLKHTVGDKVLPGSVGLDDCLDEVLGNVLVIGKELLGVLGQAIASIAKRGIVVEVANARIQAHAADNVGRVKALHFRIGVKFIEVAHAQCKVRVGKELDCLGFCKSRKKRFYRVLDCALQQERSEGLGLAPRRLIASDDDAGGVEVVVQGLGFTQELGAENNVVHPELFSDVIGVADRNRGLDDDCGLAFPFRRRILHQL